VKNSIQEKRQRDDQHLLLAADILVDQITEATFGGFSELLIAIRFFAYHESSTVVSSVEPHGGRAGITVCTIEMHARAHLDKGSALRELSWFLIFDPYESRPLIVFEYPDGADENLVSCFGLANCSPFSSSTDERHHQDGCERDRDYEEGLFQCKFPKHKFAGPTLGHKDDSVNPVVRPEPFRSIVYLRPRIRLAPVKEHGSPSFDNVCVTGGATVPRRFRSGVDGA